MGAKLVLGYAPYVFALALICLLAFTSVSKRVRGNDAWLIVIILVLSFIAGLRATSVGSDTRLYSNMFYVVQMQPTLTGAFKASTINAPIYVTYCWLLGKMGFSHQALLLLNALITNIGIGLFVKRTSDNPAVAFLLYFCLSMFFQSMNGMRQYVAIALAINAYLDFSRYGLRKLRGWVLMAFAVGVHATALVIGPAIVCALIIRNSENKTKSLLMILAGAIVIALLFEPLVGFFLRMFPHYSMYDGTRNIDIFAGSFRGRIRFLYAALLVVCVFGYLSLVGKDDANAQAKKTILELSPLCLFAAVLGLVFGTSFLINRLLWFYMIAYISFIPAVITCYRSGMNTLLEMGALLVLGIWFYAQLTENQDQVLPYMLGIGLF